VIVLTCLPGSRLFKFGSRPPPIIPPIIPFICGSLGRSTRLGGLLEERKQVGANAGILDAFERHVIVRHHALRIGQPIVECAITQIIPDDLSASE